MQSGDRDAEARLWQTCWQPVVTHARSILAQRFRTVGDEEDIASAVLESVFRRAQSGDYSALNNSHDLWRLLWVVVERKVANHVEYHLANRRSVLKTVHLSELHASGSNLKQIELPAVSNSEEQPFESLALAETLELLLAKLDEPMKRTVGLALAGHSVKEIAEMAGLKIWTIYNHLSLIRTLLERENRD